MKSFSLEEARVVFDFNVDQHAEIFKPVLDNVRLDVFEDQEYIVNARLALERLYLLVEGKAKITMTHEDGHTSIVYFVKANELIGELTLIGIEKQVKDVISIGKSICLSVPIAEVESTLLQSNAFMLSLSQYIGVKLLDRTWFNAKQQHYELKYRLAAYLLLCECDGVYNEKHTQTAEYLAVGYRHLMHTFKQFVLEGFITKIGKVYRIDKEKLEQLAHHLD